MTTALIFAGGTGQRMNTLARPKQFLELHGKPIIIYTLEHFAVHPEINNIVIVCLEGWINELKNQIFRHEISNVLHIVPGGESGGRSIYLGLKSLENICTPDDIVLIHDGVRPLIDAELISANIAKVREHGAAITVEAATESVVHINGDGLITEIPPRGEMYLAKAPQSFKYGLIWDLYQRATQEGKHWVDSAHLCSMYGVQMFSVTSTPNNIKITSPTDYYIYRALFEAMENRQVYGF